MDFQHGLEWIETIFGLEPRWKKDPQISDIEAVIKTTLKIQDCEVNFIGQGALNKLYSVQHEHDSLLVRISLPVDPFFKIESEVATLRFVRANSTLPVPNVHAFNSSRTDPIRFEWVLMDLMPGMLLRERWRSMSWPAKEAIVERMAGFSAAMYRRQFHAIGNIYPVRSGLCALEIERIVSMQFFWGEHH